MLLRGVELPATMTATALDQGEPVIVTIATVQLAHTTGRTRTGEICAGTTLVDSLPPAVDVHPSATLDFLRAALPLSDLGKLFKVVR